jgi:hypothetical protein
MSSTESTPNQPEQLNLRHASFQHRLGAIVLEIVLINVTFMIGWFIWAFIVWGEGQTPAQKILKMRTVNSETGFKASWGHMAVRFLVNFAWWIASIVTGGLALIPWLALEVIFYFTKGERTFRDYVVKTSVINEA